MDENYFINKLDKEFNQHRSLQDNGFYFTESDYQELQRNLILYKEGNGEATTYIVKTFHQFITKYARFIKNGEIPYYTITNKKIPYTITNNLKIMKSPRRENSRRGLFAVRLRNGLSSDN